MSNPVIEQITALNDFEENDLGEMPAEGLAGYAAQAAIGVLISN